MPYGPSSCYKCEEKEREEEKKKKLWMLLSLSFWASWVLPASSCQQHKLPQATVSTHCLCCTRKWQNCSIFLFERQSEDTAPQPHGSGRFLVSPDLKNYKWRAGYKYPVLQENSTCGQPHAPIKTTEVRWLGCHFRHDLLALPNTLNRFTEIFLTNAASEQDYMKSFSSPRHTSSKILSLKI